MCVAAGLLCWSLLALAVLALTGCGVAPGADDIRRAKPTVTARPDTTPVSASVDDAGGDVREVVRVVKVASGESDTQRRQIETLHGTIAELNALMAAQDDAVRAKFATLQRQVNELEGTRKRLADALAGAADAADNARTNLELAKGRIIRLEGEISMADNEMVRLRDGWDSAIAVADKQERMRVAAERENMVYRAYYESRLGRQIKTIAWSVGITLAVVIAFFIWQWFANPLGITKTFARGLLFTK